MEDYAAEFALIVDMEQRHDDLLIKIDELDKRVENVLQSWQEGSNKPAASGEPLRR